MWSVTRLGDYITEYLLSWDVSEVTLPLGVSQRIESSSWPPAVSVRTLLPKKPHWPSPRFVVNRIYEH